MMQRYFVSTYVTSPCVHEWNPELERDYFQALAGRSEIIGIEHPFSLDSARYPLDWLVRNISDHWSMIITTLPVFMGMIKEDSYVGLASHREHERNSAVNVMEQISDYVCKLNQVFNRKVVSAVHLHSFPKNDDVELRCCKSALKQSLIDIKKFDWQSAQLNLEHCDAHIPHQAAEKGFLSLEDEIEVLKDVGGFGIVLNWARSAIEGRSVLTPLTHIEQSQAACLLKGFVFSGCGDDPQSEYGCWKDTHMPPKNFINSEYLPEGGLLGRQEIEDTLALLNQDIYLGIKVSDKSDNRTLARAAGLNIDVIRALYTQRS